MKALVLGAGSMALIYAKGRYKMKRLKKDNLMVLDTSADYD